MSTTELAPAIASGRKVFGPDFNLAIARCPAWGNEDTCILVYGQHHAAAAQGFMSMPGAAVKVEQGGGFLGSPTYTYSVVTIPKEGVPT